MIAVRKLLLSSVVLSAAVLSGCAPSERETEYLGRRALLERQNQGIRELIEEAGKGSIVPADRFLVGVDEKIAGDLLRSELPIQRPLGDKFTIRLEKADVRFRDKYGVIELEGVAFRNKTPDRLSRVRVHGGLGAVSIDPITHLLKIRIAIDDLEILQAGMLDAVLGSGGKKFLASKGKELLKDQLPDLQVPVALTQKIRIPAVTSGALQLDSLVIPIDLSVERVIAARQKLWVTLDAKVGEISGGEAGLGVRLGKKKRGGKS